MSEDIAASCLSASGQTEVDEQTWPRWVARLPRCAAEPLAMSFLTGIQARGLSANTLIAYGRAVEDLIEYAGPLSSLRLNAGVVYGYLAFLRGLQSQARGTDASSLAPATLRQRLVGLRAYAEHLVDAGLLDRNPVPCGNIRRTWQGEITAARRGLVPQPRRMPRLPDDEQWARLIEALARRQLRDRLMFMLAYDGALRRSEVITLRLDDFDFSARQVSIRAENSKNGYARTVLYSPATGVVLAAYLKERRLLHVGTSFVFLSASARNRSQPVGGYTWGLLASALACEADVPGFSTHTLRHLRLTDLARAGFDIVEIAKYAGHRSLETTMLYIHLSGRDMARAFQRAAPRLVNRFATT